MFRSSIELTLVAGSAYSSDRKQPKAPLLRDLVPAGRYWPQARGGCLDLAAITVVVVGLLWRMWLAHATFFNSDEAWHYSISNQDSLLAAYKASLTLAHPPLLVLILYFWRHLGTSDLMLRLPGVLAGSIFCWIFYKWLTGVFGRTVAWVGLIFATFLPPMIALSAELRQYSLMLMFAASAAYFIERALAANSVRMMLLSCACLFLAMLSHYSAFLFAAGLAVYAIVRILSQHTARVVITSWAAGQAAGAGIAWLLYATHISKLGTVYPVAQPLQRFGDFYIGDWYFHAGRDHLLTFLYRGTFGVFRFIFGQTAIGQIAALLFLGGIVALLLGHKPAGKSSPSAPLIVILLTMPFVLNWAAVAAGLYPYGRTRHCMFLGVFALSGVSVGVVKVAKEQVSLAAVLALGMVAICHTFGTLQGRDMLPLTGQRHEHMDQALEFIRGHMTPGDVILTDQVTSFQLRHYLCGQRPVSIDPSEDGFGVFHCDGFRIVYTGLNDGALKPENIAGRYNGRAHDNSLSSANQVWVVQGGWASGLGEGLRQQFPAFSQLRIHSFGPYIEVFQLPSMKSSPSSHLTAISNDSGNTKVR